MENPMEKKKDKQMETKGLLKGLYRGDVGSFFKVLQPEASTVYPLGAGIASCAGLSKAKLTGAQGKRGSALLPYTGCTGIVVGM